ncbi:hypothetical protein AURDEDRAFT_113650 [Auricularia subglabra TFB-10046 SS5]|nr:hypothetical protein AURDEDRAFT_113650 [Auricularia subglabra TFB-10046 SS5]
MDGPKSEVSNTSLTTGRSQSDVVAELERVRAEAARTRSAYESVRAEIQLLRQAIVPPPYQDGGQSAHDSEGYT